MDQDEQDKLHWHAMNYRTAELKHAHEMWLALEAFVARRIAEAVAAERDRCECLPRFGFDSIRVTPNDRTQSIDQD